MKFKRATNAYLFRLTFNSAAYSACFRKLPLICMGDSHIVVFRYIRENKLLNHCLIDVVEVGGATAQGMINPHSRTDALGIFRQRLSKARKHQAIIFQLGEVDCGFVIWHYSEKCGITVNEQLNRSLNNYAAFMSEIISMGFKNIIVMSAPLPTIKDGHVWGEVANLRREIKATIQERTLLTIQYNKLLKNICDEKHIFYLDTTELLLDKNSGIVKDVFLNSNACDHHLHTGYYADLICKLFNELIYPKLLDRA